MKRREVEEWVRATVEDILAGQNELELVEVTFRSEGGRNILRVTLDRPGGVTLADCEWVSEALGRRLDEEDPIPSRYFLEVSSPGLDRPLVRAEDYQRFAGREVRLSTYAPINGRRNWQGELIGLTEGVVRLRVGGEEVAIPYEQVARCRLVPAL